MHLGLTGSEYIWLSTWTALIPDFFVVATIDGNKWHVEQLVLSKIRRKDYIRLQIEISTSLEEQLLNLWAFLRCTSENTWTMKAKNFLHIRSGF